MQFLKSSQVHLLMIIKGTQARKPSVAKYNRKYFKTKLEVGTRIAMSSDIGSAGFSQNKLMNSPIFKYAKSNYFRSKFRRRQSKKIKGEINATDREEIKEDVPIIHVKKTATVRSMKS
jgi:hypothetical protein